MKSGLSRVKEFAERKMSGVRDSSHNMEHVMRVYAVAETLAEGEEVDMDVIRISVLLHDIGNQREQDDPTGKTDHAEEGAKMARPFLKRLGLSRKKIAHVCDCILTHRYRTDREPKTLEAKIVFDADKLDAMGAVGMSRALCWIGRNNAHIYRKVNDVEAYAKENLGGKLSGRIQDKTKHSIQISWETKDKYLLKRLHTDRAKHIGKKRMAFYKAFLRELEKEIRGGA